MIDPKIKVYFPWSLFLVLAIIFSLGAMKVAHGEEKPSWYSWSCADLKAYLSTHSEAEARAEAVARHLPQWLIRKAEKCL